MCRHLLNALKTLEVDAFGKKWECLLLLSTFLLQSVTSLETRYLSAKIIVVLRYTTRRKLLKIVHSKKQIYFIDGLGIFFLIFEEKYMILPPLMTSRDPVCTFCLTLPLQFSLSRML